MKHSSVVLNLLVFLSTCLSSAWLFHQAEGLKVDEILPVKFETQPQSSSRFQLVGHMPNEHPLTELQFINENEGWFADVNNLWHTHDGAKTWRLIYSSRSFWSFHFIDSYTGWMNDRGELHRTNDGGHTWTQIDTPITNLDGILWSFHLEENGQVGWIAGGLFYPMEKQWDCMNNARGTLKDGSPGCLNGAVFRTDDGGLTWREQPTTKSMGRFTSINFVDANHGWVAGDAGVLHTTDGGNTWRHDRFKKGCEDYYERWGDAHPTGAIFSDQKNGLLMFEFGIVAKSVDGGKTWCGIADLPSAADSSNQCYMEPPGKFRDIAFKDADYGIAIDCLGAIFETSDGGATWQKLETAMQFNSIPFHDKTNAWLVTRNRELVKVKL
jgi:photosystem II stability/assembly factor-like uncharacterized protein